MPSATTHDEARAGAQAYLNSRLTKAASTATQHQQASSNFTVPVIDISPSLSPTSDLAARKAIATQIHDACTNSGFFQITGHGISGASRAGILDLARRFFKTVPRAEKERLHVKHTPYFRGWEPAEYTYVNPADWKVAAEEAVPETKEGFNWAYEAGLDPSGGDGKYRELDGKDVNGNVWPDEGVIEGFYDGVKAYYGEVLGLARHMFRLFALSLDLEEGFFDEMITHPGGIGRLLYYPPAKEIKPLGTDGKDKEIGLGAHSDYECFTILLSSAATGLEILTPEDQWIEAPAVEGGLMVNVGDFLMRWTNGVFQSTVHRVVNRTTEERYSVPIFNSINYEQVVETLPSCITPDNPSKYPPIRAGEYILERLKATIKDS